MRATFLVNDANTYVRCPYRVTQWCVYHKFFYLATLPKASDSGPGGLEIPFKGSKSNVIG